MSRPMPRSPTIWPASSRTCGRCRSIRSWCGRTGSRPTTMPPTGPPTRSTTTPARTIPSPRVGQRDRHRRGHQRRAVSGDSFQVRWQRATFENGTLAETKRYTARPLHRAAAAPHGGDAQEEPPRHLRPRPQLEPRPHRGRQPMKIIDDPRYIRPWTRRLCDKATAARDQLSMRRISTRPPDRRATPACRDRRDARALPLPGQLKPAAGRAQAPTKTMLGHRKSGSSTPTRPPGRADNGRLHQCHAGLSLHGRRALPALHRAEQVSDIALQPGERDRRGLGGRHRPLGHRRHRAAGRERPPASMCW